jgi:Domain of unknown function (DU1801)
VASRKRTKTSGSVAASPLGVADPAQQLSGFIAKFSPEIAALAKAVLAKMRKRLPGAVELVYDNYNALAIGFGPGERASEAVFSIALFPRWISLFFLQGANLHDPQKILKGSGTRARHIVLKDAGSLDDPAIQALIAQALKTAVVPIDPSSKRRLVIKSVSEKQRPRLPK